MSNVIQFLEAMGADARLSRMDDAQYEDAVLRLGANADAVDALLAKSQWRLADVLNARPTMFCMVMAPEDENEKEEQEGGEETPEKKEQQE